MATTWTSNYAGKYAGEIMRPVLLSANTLSEGLVNIHEGIRNKTNIPILTVDEDIVQAYACDFTDEGTSATTEKILEVTRLMTNMKICKETFFATWLEDQTGTGSYLDAQIPNDWYSAFQDQAGGQISKVIELNLWQGNLNTGSFTSTYTDFDGLLTKLDADAATIKADISAITAANVIDQMRIGRDAMSAAMVGDYTFEYFVNRVTFQLFRQAVSNDFNGFEYGNAPELMLDGYKINVCAGIPDNLFAISKRENLHFGTNLVSDENNIQLVDTTQTLGDQNVRISAVYSGGTQVTNASDIVLCGVNIES